MRQDVCDSKKALLYLSLYEMIIQSNMLHMRVEDWICAEVGGSYVVAIDCWDGGNWNA